MNHAPHCAVISQIPNNVF